MKNKCLPSTGTFEPACIRRRLHRRQQGQPRPAQFLHQPGHPQRGRRHPGRMGSGLPVQHISGYTEGTVGFGVDALGLLGVKLDSGKGRHYNPDSSKYGGTVFPTDENGRAVDNFGSLGLTGKVRLSKTEARIGTLQPKLPVVTFSDGRLLPQTFEGGQITSAEIDNLTLVGGQLEHAKGRSSSNNEGLSISGANNAKTGQFSNKLLRRWRLQDRQGPAGAVLLRRAERVLPPALPRPDPQPGHRPGRAEIRPALLQERRRRQERQRRRGGQRLCQHWLLRSERGRQGDHQGRSGQRHLERPVHLQPGGHGLSAGYQEVSGDSNFPYLNQGDGATAYLITDRQIGKSPVPASAPGWPSTATTSPRPAYQV